MFVLFVTLLSIIGTSNGILRKDPRTYGRTYPAIESNDGYRLIRKYPLHRIEVILSFHFDEDMTRVAETAIEDHYSSIKSRMGEEVDEIGKIMEYFYGGKWSVAFFEDPYMFAYTLQRRSPSFIVLDVDGYGVAVSREERTR